MLLSLNRTYKGKLPPFDYNEPEIADLWATFTRSFENVDITTDQFIEEIQEGHAYCAQLRGGRRSTANFLRAQTISVDMDSGGYDSSLQGIGEHEFCNRFASFAYTTPSHTEGHPRSRVVFKLSTPITNPHLYRIATESVINLFPGSDDVCKDPARLFYGSPGCLVMKWHGMRVLPTSVLLNQYAKPYYAQVMERIERKRKQFSANGEAGEIDPFIDRIIEGVMSAPDGNKASELNRAAYTFGGLVGSGMIDFSGAFDLLYNAIIARNIKSEQQAEQIIRSGISAGMSRPILPPQNTSLTNQTEFLNLFKK